MMDDFERLKAELLADPDVLAAYNERLPAYEFASNLITMRTRMGISQGQLAAKAGMSQPEIARMESGLVCPTWETISRLFGAVGAEIDIKFEDEEGKPVRLTISPGGRPRRRRANSGSRPPSRSSETSELPRPVSGRHAR